MQAISIQASDEMVRRYNLSSGMTFDELLKIIQQEQALEALNRAQRIAMSTDLHNMSDAEIAEEINAVRRAQRGR